MIKLLILEEIDGLTRLQSQLYVGKNIADFILKDGVLKIWTYINGVCGFEETTIPYEIKTKMDMIYQPL